MLEIAAGILLAFLVIAFLPLILRVLLVLVGVTAFVASVAVLYFMFVGGI